MKQVVMSLINRLEANPKGKVLVQFVKFGMVGVSNTLLSLVITYLVMAIFRFGFSLETIWTLDIATTVGYVAGVCNSYFWNKRYVFRDGREKDGRKAFSKMFVCYGVTYLLSMLLMNVLVDYLHVPSIIAPIPRLLLTIPLNFAANKLWAFRDK